MLRLGITREAQKVARLLSKASENGVQIVPLPLVDIVPLSFSMPNGLNLSKVDWIFFGSSNAVEIFFKRLQTLKLTFPPTVRIAAVGPITAEAVRGFGYEVNFVPSGSTGQDMFHEWVVKYAAQGARVLYARPNEVAFDPDSLLRSQGCAYTPLICYEVKAGTVDPSVVAQFTSDDTILFTSPFSVKTFNNSFGTPVARPLAIGITTAREMVHCNWPSVSTMAQANIDKVLEYV